MGTGGAHRRAAQDHAERGHPGCRGASTSRRSSATARRCRSTSGTGYDLNADGVNNDIYTTAYQFTGIDDAGDPSFKDIGACETINCGRGAALSQFNLRVSKAFTAAARDERRGDRRGLQPVQRDQPGIHGAARPRQARSSPARAANHAANTVFMKPTRVRGRRRPARAARRTVRVQVYVLDIARSRSLQARGLRLPGLFVSDRRFCLHYSTLAGRSLEFGSVRRPRRRHLCLKRRRHLFSVCRGAPPPRRCQRSLRSRRWLDRDSLLGAHSVLSRLLSRSCIIPA